MPFDGTNYTNDAVTRIDPVTDLLETAWGLIDKPQKWCRGHYQNGHRYCSAGALDAAPGFADTDHYMARALLGMAMQCPIPLFNDSHSHAEVAAAWRRAIAMSRDHG